MLLLERSSYLKDLQTRFHSLDSEGHTVFLLGEAGVGKTSLVTEFLNALGEDAVSFTGACDSLFTPRPLGPLFDIAPQLGSGFSDLLKNERDRSVIFSQLYSHLISFENRVVLVIEDIHWADEATNDFIKFLGRRIARVKCLLILTCRNDELHSRHPVKSLFGELAPGTFTKTYVQVLSRQAVNEFSLSKGNNSGEKIYSLTGGNPFYVSEILANENHRIPERVKDSILAVFHSKDEHVRSFWELLSILPSRIEFDIVRKLEQDFPNAIDEALSSGVIVDRKDYLAFKHELFRLTIEESLSKYRQRNLHGLILKMLLEETGDVNLAQLVHHARLAEDRVLVGRYAPKAAREASLLGAHMESSRLYQIAIDYSDQDHPASPEVYAAHAYECYLTNQLVKAVESQKKALALWTSQKNLLRTGDTLRFLSRLWWFTGNRSEAITFAQEAIKILDNGIPTRELALAFSNLSQLSMLADDFTGTTEWGNRAIALAERLNDREILCHALNNVGSILMKTVGSTEEGVAKLTQSLGIALEHGLHEHAARAYTNTCCFYLLIKQYENARRIFDKALEYCDELDLLSWSSYIRGEQSKLLLETGAWDQAERIASTLQQNPEHLALTRIGSTTTLARILIRKGRFDEARQYVEEGRAMAMPTGEAYRVVLVIAATLELAWLTNEPVSLPELEKLLATFLPQRNRSWYYATIAYWMKKCGLPTEADSDLEYVGPFKFESDGRWEAAALAWKELGCPYEEALALLECDEPSQKHGLLILDQLGATATRNKYVEKLRSQGVRQIPRGPRESTRNNPAQLTERQVEILALLKLGRQNKEIAELLFISPKTVDHHISAILSKLEVNSRSRAVTEAERLGILK